MDFSLINVINLRCSYRIFSIFVNPFSFISYLFFPLKGKEIKLRTPIGKVSVLMRNRQSARTLYSIFVREDYLIDKNQKNILDIGSNIGISALYFLSRNKKNRIYCVEPDPNNAYFLKKNLKRFKNRSEISFVAITSDRKKYKNFNLSFDGKYSSFREIGEILDKTIKVKTKTIDDLLNEDFFYNKLPILLKLDIEGLEKEVINNFDFRSHPRIIQLIAEGIGYKENINKNGTLEVINGYIEKYTFY